jgi:hypothetical protein
MKKPTIDEARKYAKDKGLEIDIDYWWWKNEERGWVVVVGNKAIPMKSWKGNLQTWYRNQLRFNPSKPKESNGTTFREQYKSSRPD